MVEELPRFSLLFAINWKESKLQQILAFLNLPVWMILVRFQLADQMLVYLSIVSLEVSTATAVTRALINSLQILG
jgi:hypothetical protein